MWLCKVNRHVLPYAAGRVLILTIAFTTVGSIPPRSSSSAFWRVSNLQSQGGARVVVRQERGRAGAAVRGAGLCNRRRNVWQILGATPHHRRIRTGWRRRRRLRGRDRREGSGRHRGQWLVRGGEDRVVPPPRGRWQGSLRLREHGKALHNYILLIKCVVE